MNFPAFKEWSVIVSALGTGEQLLILRKGGISEGPAGFQIGATRFWLFPTRFHQQFEKTKPAAARFAPPANTPAALASSAPAHIELRYFADLAHTAFLTDWPAVARLDPHHLWTESTVRERFDWSRPAGLHVLVVRIHKLATPLSLPLTPDMAGCKSWIDLPIPFDAHPSAPVLSDAAFATRLSALSL
ncbi:hypothetical protein CMV30_16290 [Nibricoccus aquaticus]|uniref:DUF1802 domain-containing protein n=1 Tax=Nibricoccus aquaticus TaxID=2576891 RepID=A0A290QAV9_9BACT|nr:DUF1802 family protein [Nibricoccus aquaticus]ATC65377.1 hypothetical protein CMV30_16290 [Nibricoccus aquaticus]